MTPPTNNWFWKEIDPEQSYVYQNGELREETISDSEIARSAKLRKEAEALVTQGDNLSGQSAQAKYQEALEKLPIEPVNEALRAEITKKMNDIVPEGTPDKFVTILEKENKDITDEEIDKILSSDDYGQPWYDAVNPRITRLRDQRNVYKPGEPNQSSSQSESAELKPLGTIEVSEKPGYSILYDTKDLNAQEKLKSIEELYHQYAKQFDFIEKVYGKKPTIVLVPQDDWQKFIEDGLKGNKPDASGKLPYPAVNAGAWNHPDIGPTLQKHLGQNISGEYPGMLLKSNLTPDQLKGYFSNEIFDLYSDALFKQNILDGNADNQRWTNTAPIQISTWLVDHYFEKVPDRHSTDDLIAVINQTPNVLSGIHTADMAEATAFYQGVDTSTGSDELYARGIPDNVRMLMQEILLMKIASHMGKTADEIPIEFTYDSTKKLLVAKKKFAVPEKPKDALQSSDTVELKKFDGYNVLYKKGDTQAEGKMTELEGLYKKNKDRFDAIQESYGKPLTIVLVENEAAWKEVIEGGLRGNQADSTRKPIFGGSDAGAWNYFDISPTLKQHFGQEKIVGLYPGILFQSYEDIGEFDNTFSNEFFESYASSLFHKESPQKHEKEPWEEVAPLQVAGWYIDYYFKENPQGKDLHAMISLLNSDGVVARRDGKTVGDLYREGDKQQKLVGDLYVGKTELPSHVLQVMNAVLQQKMLDYASGDQTLRAEVEKIQFTFDAKTGLLHANYGDEVRTRGVTKGAAVVAPKVTLDENSPLTRRIPGFKLSQGN